MSTEKHIIAVVGGTGAEGRGALRWATAGHRVVIGSRDARRTVIAPAADAGLRGIDAGPLANSAASEALTSLLIWINRTYKIPGAGIAITGLP